MKKKEPQTRPSWCPLVEVEGESVEDGLRERITELENFIDAMIEAEHERIQWEDALNETWDD